MPIEELLRLGCVRPVVRWSDSLLHRPAAPVVDFGRDLQMLLADMFATNTAANGAGLAAQQVGIDLAVFVYDCTDADGLRRTGAICNPVLATGDRSASVAVEEGCLSFPGAWAPLSRPDHALCRGQDQFGDTVEVSGTGTLARCLQHETDHTKGIVFGDRLSRRWRRRLQEEHEANVEEYSDDWPMTPRRAN